MPNREISLTVFTRFITDNGWMEIYYEPDYNLTRYITPSGNVVDAEMIGDKVKVNPFTRPFPLKS